MPSVVTNAHTHLELSALGRLCPEDALEFTRWMRRLALRLPFQTRRRALRAVEEGIDALRACGTTQVGDISSSGLTVDPLLESGLEGIVWIEVRGLSRVGGRRSLDRARERIRALRPRAEGRGFSVGLSLHAPYSCGPELLREGAAWCRREAVPLCIHAAESPAETELLVHGRGPFVPRTLRPVVGWIGVPRMRPVPYLASLGVLDARPLLVHLAQADAEDVRLVAESGCAAVHCPRSNSRLDCGRMPLERFLKAGVSVYLGTDSCASSPSLNVIEEAEYACRLHEGRVEPERIRNLMHKPLRENHGD